MCLSGLFSSATANAPPKDAIDKTDYLALGDSISFGFNPTVPIDLNNYQGYPQFVSKGLGHKVANASCVGESSGSFVRAGAPDLGCAQWKAAGEPMWITYS